MRRNTWIRCRGLKSDVLGVSGAPSVVWGHLLRVPNYNPEDVAMIGNCAELMHFMWLPLNTKLKINVEIMLENVVSYLPQGVHTLSY